MNVPSFALPSCLIASGRIFADDAARETRLRSPAAQSDIVVDESRDSRQNEARALKIQTDPLQELHS